MVYSFTGAASVGGTPSELANLSTEPFELELSFSRLRTQDGREIDLRVKVLCKITNPVSFLHRWKDRLDAQNCIQIFDIEGRVKNNLLPKITDLITEHTVSTTWNADPPVGRNLLLSLRRHH